MQDITDKFLDARQDTRGIITLPKSIIQEGPKSLRCFYHGKRTFEADIHLVDSELAGQLLDDYLFLGIGGLFGPREIEAYRYDSQRKSFDIWYYPAYLWPEESATTALYKYVIFPVPADIQEVHILDHEQTVEDLLK